MNLLKETAPESIEAEERQGQSSREINLLSRIATGDHQAFAALYRKYRKLLYQMAQRIVQDEHEAEDVLQNVFLKIWMKGASQYHEALARPFSWLFAITWNQAINHMRRRRPVLPSSEALHAEALTTAPEPTLPADQVRKDVMTQVLALPDSQRRAIELAFFHDLTHKQISRTLGKPLGVIKASIRRGMFRMKTGLEEPDRNHGGGSGARPRDFAPLRPPARPGPSRPSEKAFAANIP